MTRHPKPFLPFTWILLLGVALSTILWSQPAMAFVYWTNYFGHTVGRANNDGSGADQNWITGCIGPTGLAIDTFHIYWANKEGNSIARANLDGSGAVQDWITGCSLPVGLEVDGTYVYWTHHYPDRLGRANIDGTGVVQDWITDCAGPKAITVDGNYVYWTNLGGGTLGRANLDGSAPDKDWITNPFPHKYPMGIAVDADYFYWTDNYEDKVSRANLDGSGIVRNWISVLDDSYLGGVTVTADTVYWASHGQFRLGRANLDGTSVDETWMTGSDGPWDIVIDDGSLVLLDDAIIGISGSESCKESPGAPIDPCTPDLAPGYPRFTLNPGSDDDLYEDYITIRSLSESGIQMPLNAVLKTLTPTAVHAFNTDGGGERPTTGYWEYSLTNNDGTTSADDTLDLDERVSRIWQFVNEGGVVFSFWVDVYAGLSRESARLGQFDLSRGASSREAAAGEAELSGILDDGTAEIHGGSTSGNFIVANRFSAPSPVALESVSFYTSGWAAGNEVALIIYESSVGADPVPDPAREVWRTAVILEDGGFQEVPTRGCPTLNRVGAQDGAFFVAVANTASRSFTLGIDQDGPYAGASYVSIDGGLTYQLISSLPIIDGNAMIRVSAVEVGVCFLGTIEGAK